MFKKVLFTILVTMFFVTHGVVSADELHIHPYFEELVEKANQSNKSLVSSFEEVDSDVLKRRARASGKMLGTVAAGGGTAWLIKKFLPKKLLFLSELSVPLSLVAAPHVIGIEDGQYLLPSHDVVERDKKELREDEKEKLKETLATAKSSYHFDGELIPDPEDPDLFKEIYIEFHEALGQDVYRQSLVHYYFLMDVLFEDALIQKRRQGGQEISLDEADLRGMASEVCSKSRSMLSQHDISGPVLLMSHSQCEEILFDVMILNEDEVVLLPVDDHDFEEEPRASPEQVLSHEKASP